MMETLDRKHLFNSDKVAMSELDNLALDESRESAPARRIEQLGGGKDKQGGNRKNGEAPQEKRERSGRKGGHSGGGKKTQNVTKYKQFGPIDFPPLMETRSTKSSAGIQGERKISGGLGVRSATHGEIRRNKSDVGDRNNIYCGAKSQDNVNQILSKINSSRMEESSTRLGSRERSPEDQLTLKKGILWHQRDKIFSRWKERFFILTRDYLQCFKKGSSRITEMGEFLFKIKLSEVDTVELMDRRGYLTISLLLSKDGKILLRKPEGIREWFNIVKICTRNCHEKSMKSTEEFWSKRQFTDPSNMEVWLDARNKIGLQYAYSDKVEKVGLQYAYSDSSPALNKLQTRSEERHIVLDKKHHKVSNKVPAQKGKSDYKSDGTHVHNKKDYGVVMKQSKSAHANLGQEGVDRQNGVNQECERDSGNDSFHTNTSSGESAGSDQARRPNVSTKQNYYGNNRELLRPTFPAYTTRV